MDKKAVMYVVAALAIILVVALVIKPMMTKQPVNDTTSLSAAALPPGTNANSTMSSVNSSAVNTTTLTGKPSLKPTPKRNLSVQSIGFVDPSAYHITMDNPIPNGTHFDQIPVNTSRTTIAKISGQFSGVTQVIEIPYPYWELVYTIQPSTAPVPGITQVTPTEGEGVSSSGVSGSYSTSSPVFTIQVMDANDPNRIVRTISPPGGIDLNLWLGKKNVVTNPQDNSVSSTTPSNVPYNDPRPWTEKFFEGERSYYFVITAHSLDSYTIQIQVPSTYIGKY